MLNKTPEIRVGGSYAALKANSWFDHFDWVLIYLIYNSGQTYGQRTQTSICSSKRKSDQRIRDLEAGTIRKKYFRGNKGSIHLNV